MLLACADVHLLMAVSYTCFNRLRCWSQHATVLFVTMSAFSVLPSPKLQACRCCSNFGRQAVRCRPPTAGHTLKRRALLPRLLPSSRVGAHRAGTVTAQAAATSLQDSQLQPVQSEGGQRTAYPASAGVYAVYNRDQKIQYIGLSRKVQTSSIELLIRSSAGH